MKNLMFYVLLLLLFSCSQSNDGNRADEKSITDTTSELRENAATVETVPNIHNEINTILEKGTPILYTHLWHPNNKLQDEEDYIAFDTIIGEWEVSSKIQVSLDSKEYVKYMGHTTYYDIDDKLISCDVIFYGRTGRIVFKHIESTIEKADTLYVNRIYLSKKLGLKNMSLEDWALLSLDFGEVRNDSIIFLADFGIPDSDAGHIMEIKFSVHNPIESLVVEDITSKIWTFDED